MDTILLPTKFTFCFKGRWSHSPGFSRHSPSCAHGPSINVNNIPLYHESVPVKIIKNAVILLKGVMLVPPHHPRCTEHLCKTLGHTAARLSSQWQGIGMLILSPLYKDAQSWVSVRIAGSAELETNCSSFQYHIQWCHLTAWDQHRWEYLYRGNQEMLLTWGVSLPMPCPPRKLVVKYLAACHGLLESVKPEWKPPYGAVWSDRSTLSPQAQVTATLYTKCQRPWCWEGLRAGGEGGSRGWDGWMASSAPWTWVWASSGR